ncbi:MAG: transcriptional repressor [Chitinivibrionales bacterium]|nr:transcriptional repressor [Chitinivibrionales bacterium]
MRSLAAEIRAAGLRATPQRVAIYRELAGTDTHPDVEAVYRRIRRRLPSVSLDTVYRTLASLESAGLVSRVDPVGGRVRYDANTEAHHHFVCTRCGSIQDIPVGPGEPIEAPGGTGSVGRADSVHVHVRGTCRACMGRGRAER